MKKEQIFFDEIEILEWYDGIVRGIGVGDGKSYLIVLASWDTAMNTRLYLVLDLDENTRQTFRAKFENNASKEENWQAFAAVFDDFIKNYSGKVRSIQDEIIVGKKFQMESIHTELLDRIVPYDIRNVIRRDK